MATSGKQAVTMEELLFSSLVQTDALAECQLRRVDYARRVYADDFRGTGDVSKTFKSYSAMTIPEILIWEALFYSL